MRRGGIWSVREAGFWGGGRMRTEDARRAKEMVWWARVIVRKTENEEWP